jgi:hypothetical protein
MAGNPRVVALVTGLLGLGTIGIALAFSFLPLVKAGGSCVIPGAVVQFEFARSMADLLHIFGPDGGACRGPALAAMDQANTFDVWAFIPAYTAFNLAAILFLAGSFRGLALAAAAAAVGALVADYVETLNLLAITKDLAANVGLLAVSTPAAWTKFALLGLHGLLLAAICWRSTPRRVILGGVLVLPTLATVVLALDAANQGPFVLAAILAWGSLTAIALWKGLRGA